MKKIILCIMVLCLSTHVFATTFGEHEQTCSVCHSKNQYTVLTSTNQLSPPSLDNRPGEMARFATLGIIQKCPVCGLVSYDVSKKICENQDKIVRSPKYQSLLNDKGVNKLSQEYQAYAYLLEKCGSDKDKIANAYLRAAWAADDKQEKENAINFRKKVISYLQDSNNINDKITLFDLYRRTAQFKIGLNLISQIKVDENDKNACLYNGLIQHQKELLKKKNTEDQRMIHVLYCPPDPKDDQGTIWAINDYVDAINDLEKQGDTQKVSELQSKLISLLEGKKRFIDRFVLTYFYYQTNQLDKAHKLEETLTFPNHWDGFFNKKYGNSVLWSIEADIKNDNVPDTPFYKLAKEMIKVRQEAMKPKEISQREQRLSFYSADILNKALNKPNPLEKLLAGGNKTACGATIKYEQDNTAIVTFPKKCEPLLSPQDSQLNITIEDVIKSIQSMKNVKASCSSDNICHVKYEKDDEI